MDIDLHLHGAPWGPTRTFMETSTDLCGGYVWRSVDNVLEVHGGLWDSKSHVLEVGRAS